MVISFCVPYDKVSHAGGKTHNYYLKKINEEKDIDVSLISFGVDSDRLKLDLDGYHIKNHIFYIENNKLSKIKRGILNLTSKYNPFDKYGNMLPKYYENSVIGKLMELKKKGEKVDIFILEWTQMVFLAPKINKLFPDSKIIASEHDVSYLGVKRKYEFAKKSKDKNKLKRFYTNVKEQELNALRQCEWVFPHNKKDEKLLINDGIDKAKVQSIVPFYDDYSKIVRQSDGKSIIFYGAMARPENYLSAIWFIDNVMANIYSLGVDFVIVGSNPAKELLDAAKEFNQKAGREAVKLTGFVLQVNPYFEKAVCMVAPLVLGAGIKVKIIEALCGGVPVITNSIGIEGIFAKNGEEYIHCETPEEYVQSIKSILEGTIDINILSENARKFIEKHFDLEKSAVDYVNILHSCK